jgi:hypothetical protein
METTAFNPHATIGALEIGVLLSSFLFGIVTVQTFMYFKKFPNDTWMLKLLVRTTHIVAARLLTTFYDTECKVGVVWCV